MQKGLCNDPKNFQSFMNRIFYVLIDQFLVVYMEYLLIFHKDEYSHLEQVETGISRLKEHKIYLSQRKYN